MCFTERFLSCCFEHYIQASYTLLRKSKITVEVGHTVLYHDPGDDDVIVTALSVYPEDALFLFHAHTHTHTHTHTHIPTNTATKQDTSWSWIILTSAYGAQGLVLLYQERLSRTKPEPVLNLSAVCSRGPSAALLNRSRFPAYWFFLSLHVSKPFRERRHIYLNNFCKTAIRKTIYPAYSTYEWNVCTKKNNMTHDDH